jgi:hypothetical protein
LVFREEGQDDDDIEVEESELVLNNINPHCIFVVSKRGSLGLAVDDEYAYCAFVFVIICLYHRFNCIIE